MTGNIHTILYLAESRNFDKFGKFGTIVYHRNASHMFLSLLLLAEMSST